MKVAYLFTAHRFDPYDPETLRGFPDIRDGMSPLETGID